EAMDAYHRKKPEIDRLRKTYPADGVRLDFYFQFQPGVNRDFPDKYQFEELTVASLATGFQGVVLESLARGAASIFTGFLPALRPDLKPLQPAAAPSDPLYQGYLLVRRAVEPPAPYPYAEAFRLLNGSPMYDILRILDHLAKDGLFNLLNNLLPTAAGV